MHVCCHFYSLDPSVSLLGAKGEAIFKVPNSPVSAHRRMHWIGKLLCRTLHFRFFLPYFKFLTLFLGKLVKAEKEVANSDSFLSFQFLVLSMALGMENPVICHTGLQRKGRCVYVVKKGVCMLCKLT